MLEPIIHALWQQMCTPRQQEQLRERERLFKETMKFVNSQGETSTLNVSNVGKNSEEENTSRRMDEGPSSVFLVGKSPTVSTIPDTKEMSQRMPEKSGSELELDRYIQNARLETSQGTLDRRNPYQFSKRGPRAIPSPDVDLVHMPFLDAATTDSIKGVNPQLMDVLHNQFASIADAFKMQRDWTTAELRQVHNQMY